MSRNFKKGNAGVTILVVVVILIVAGILFFVNRGDEAVMIDVNATTTPATTTPVAPATTSMEDGATSTATTSVNVNGGANVQ
jgi:hypothetical protein